MSLLYFIGDIPEYVRKYLQKSETVENPVCMATASMEYDVVSSSSLHFLIVHSPIHLVAFFPVVFDTTADRYFADIPSSVA